MIRGIVGRWRQWKDRRRKQRALPAEYDALAREFGLLTARCLQTDEALEKERGFTRQWTEEVWTLRRRLACMQQEHATMLSDLPGLTPGEVERLAILSEECGEVVRAIGKISRYGWESTSPFVVGGRTNRQTLERELGSLRAVVNMMLDSQDVRLNALQSWQRTKKTALENWTLYQASSMPRAEQIAMVQSIQRSAAGN
jgi:NTP pyrophosphatase (non-canonical NTP hydrolase)